MSLIDLSRDIVLKIQGQAGDTGVTGPPSNVGVYKVGSSTTIGTNSVALLPQASSDTKMVYTQVGEKIQPIGYNLFNGAGPEFGKSMCMSADCLTLAIGGPSDSFNNVGAKGSVFIYTRTSTSLPWKQVTTGLPGSIVKITPSDITNGSDKSFGHALAISDDGNTLAVGGRYDDNNTNDNGAVWIFVRSSGVWTQQAKLFNNTEIGSGNQGTSVSLSSDGNTVAFGAPRYNGDNGGVLIFTRSGVTWTQYQFLHSISLGDTTNIKFGSTLSLSGDGKLLAIGAPLIYTNTTTIGGVLVYALVSGTWTRISTGLPGGTSYIKGTGIKNTETQQQGTSICLSKDGSTLVVANNTENSNAGWFWIFSNVGGVWTQQEGPLSGTGIISGYTGNNSIFSLGLSSDGSTLAVGSSRAKFLTSNGNLGVTWIWKRNGTKWSQYGDPLQGGVKETSVDYFEGYSVCLSQDGKKLVTGAIAENNYVGAAYYYEGLDYYNQTNYQGTESVAIGAFAGVTSQATTIGYYPATFTTGTKVAVGSGSNRFGANVAVSGDGLTMAVGGETYSSVVGVYILSAGVWTLQTTFSIIFGVVSLSEDGNTLAIGNMTDNSSQGSVSIYVRSGTTWTLQQKIIDTSITSLSGLSSVQTYQGASVSLSSDGNTVAFGAPCSAGGYGGSFFIWTRTGTVWSREYTNTVYQTFNVAARMGSSISLSGDGSSVVVGAPFPSPLSTANIAHVYFKSSPGTWQNDVKSLNSFWPVSASQFGASVAFSKDGTTVAVGAPSANTDRGATYLFKIKGVTPSYIGVVQDTTSSTTAYQGCSVSLSSDGNVLAVGAKFDNGIIGTVRTYKRTTLDSLFQFTSLLTPGNIIGTPYFGYSVSIDYKGTTLLAGGPTDNSVGAVWSFSPSYANGSSVAIGSQAGSYKQGSGSIALGHRAGEMNQGAGSLAIGYKAGQLNQPANSTFISKSSVRMYNATYNYCQFNPASGEISYCPSGYSDKRLKENMADVNKNDLQNVLKKVNLKKFDFIDKSMSGNKYGVIANELQTIENLGNQTIGSGAGFIPNMFTSTTFDCLDENMKTLPVTVEMVDSPSLFDENGEEVKVEQTERKVAVVGPFLKINATQEQLALCKVGGKIRFFTFQNDTIPLDYKTKGMEEVGGMDHQSEIIRVTDTGVIVSNTNSITNLQQNTIVYGTWKDDILTIGDSNNVSYLLVASVQKLLDEFAGLTKDVSDLQEVFSKNNL